MSKIKVEITNAYSIEYTPEELSQEIRDLLFLKDSALVLLNPDVASNSDLPFDKETTIKYLKELYEDSSYSKEFINKIFN